VMKPLDANAADISRSDRHSDSSLRSGATKTGYGVTRRMRARRSQAKASMRTTTSSNRHAICLDCPELGRAWACQPGLTVPPVSWRYGARRRGLRERHQVWRLSKSHPCDPRGGLTGGRRCCAADF
jgi:hypothetical protein